VILRRWLWTGLTFGIWVQSPTATPLQQITQDSLPALPGIGWRFSDGLDREFGPANLFARLQTEKEAKSGAERANWLTLEDLLKSVAKSYPLLLAAEQERAIAEAELLGAQGGFDTTLRSWSEFAPTGRYIHRRYDLVLEQPTQLWGSSFYSGYRQGSGTFAPYDGKQATLSDGEWRSGFRLPLWRNGPTDRRRANVQIAEMGQGVAGASIEFQRLAIVRSATRRYWEWVAAGNRYRVTRSLLETAETRNGAIAEAVRLGQFPPIDLTDNARAVLERRSQLVAAERLVQQTSIELSLFHRDLAGNTVIPNAKQLPPAFPEPEFLNEDSVAKDSSLALSRRPELLRLSAQIAQARVERRLAANQRQPAIDLLFGFSQDVGSGSPTISRKESEAGFAFDFPLQRRAAIGKMQAEDAKLERLTRQEQFARDRIVAEIQDAVSAVRTAYQRLGLAREELKAARQLEEAERTKLDLGDSTLFVLNLRELTTADTAIREVLALLDYHLARADYKASIAER